METGKFGIIKKTDEKDYCKYVEDCKDLYDRSLESLDKLMNELIKFAIDEVGFMGMFGSDMSETDQKMASMIYGYINSICKITKDQVDLAKRGLDLSKGTYLTIRNTEEKLDKIEDLILEQYKAIRSLQETVKKEKEDK